MSADNSYDSFGAAIPSDDGSALLRQYTSPILTPSADTPELSRPADTVRRTAPPRSPRTRGRTLLSIIAVTLGILILLASGGLYYLDRRFDGKIYPNVTVQGIPVGLMTPEQAEAALRERYQPFISHPATVVLDGQRWQPSLAEIGGSFAFSDSIDAAYRSGRGNGLISNLTAVYQIWRNGLELPVRVTVDERRLQGYLQNITADSDVAALDAQVVRDGVNTNVSPSRTGRQILLDETVQNMSAALVGLTPQTIEVRTRELRPRLSDADALAAKKSIDTILAGPLTLRAAQLKADEVWPPEVLAPMVELGRVTADPQRDTLQVTVNPYQIERRLRTIAQQVQSDSTLPRVSWNGGDLKITKPGNPGTKLDEQQAFDLVIGALNGQTGRELTLPVVNVDPPVTEKNLKQLGINEQIGLGRSDFVGSADYRIHNIGAGMNLLDGLLIPPGAEFSFNNTVGEIDETNGFVKGYAIIENRTQLEFGGGICQDSTTVFRAAFWAGLPFTERNTHQFYIAWYDKYALGSLGAGPGMDATIFTGPGGADLRFVNDTGSWILMQAGSNPRNGVAEVALYGTDTSRQVSITHKIYDRTPARTDVEFVADKDQPRGSIHRTDTARGGMTIDIYRTVTSKGVAGKPELFRTRFTPWGDKYAVNPADFGPDGRPLSDVLPESMRPKPPEPTPGPDGTIPADPNAPAVPAVPAATPAPADPAQPAPTPVPQG